jgi:hypothetical protein
MVADARASQKARDVGKTTPMLRLLGSSRYAELDDLH